MPSFLEYIEAKGALPTCLTMSFAAYIAFFSNEIQELNEQGLVCRRPKGNRYTCSDDRWVLEFYWNHRNDSEEELVHAVMTDLRMWGQDLTQIPGFEGATVANLRIIRAQGAAVAFASCL
jgi:tagaturonate reductase